MNHQIVQSIVSKRLKETTGGTGPKVSQECPEVLFIRRIEYHDCYSLRMSLPRKKTFTKYFISDPLSAHFRILLIV